MQTLAPILSAADLRREMLLALDPFIGQYERPNLPPAKAVWVLDRPIPKGYSVIRSVPDAIEPVPALEIVIEYAPTFERKGRNHGSSLIAEGWRTFLVFHDDRQDPRPVLRSMVANFQTAGDFSYQPPSELIPAQYSAVVKNRIVIKDNT